HSAIGTPRPIAQGHRVSGIHLHKSRGEDLCDSFYLSGAWVIGFGARIKESALHVLHKA
ncbi:hypothetical protein J6590_103878, partial [Homalodisca vitripennis]